MRAARHHESVLQTATIHDVNLRPHDVSELRRLVEDGVDLPHRLPAPTLGAAIELACTAWSWRLAGRHCAFERFQGWAQASSVLDDAWRSLEGDRPMGAEYSATALDVRSATDVTAQGLFGNRFRKSLVEIGKFSNAFANGLGGALEEMVDNVFQHSTDLQGRGAPAVMAYEVGAQSFDFCVGDVGRGVLNSLSENPHWSALNDDEAALDAVVVHRASRRGADPGTGFQLVVRTLADLGAFRYRTGNAYVAIETDAAAHARTTAIGASVALRGVQLVVSSSKI